MDIQRIKIIDFSDFPAGRDRDRDPYSGEEFRDDWLLPALEKGVVEVDFADVYACLPSFLEEAFGGLVRKGKSQQVLKEQLKFAHTDRPQYNEYIEAIWRYIGDAQAREKNMA